jgi:uncharacterized membrane protein YeaQ/YmgE (transglycosylase-associated protein family)
MWRVSLHRESEGFPHESPYFLRSYRDTGAIKPRRLILLRKAEELHPVKLREVVMSLFVWILLGLVSGFIASHLVSHRGEGVVLDVLLGVVGAIIGGWVFHLFGHIGVTGLNLYSIVVATVGAVVFLILYHTIRRHA